MTPPALPDSAFTRVEPSRLTEALCLEDERTVGRDNTIAWNGMRLQLPESPLRRHYVQARVKVHAYPDGLLAVPNVIAQYTPEGVLKAALEQATKRVPAATSMAPGIDRPDRIVLVDPVIEAFGQQCRLASICSLHEPCHDRPRKSLGES